MMYESKSGPTEFTEFLNKKLSTGLITESSNISYEFNGLISDNGSEETFPFFEMDGNFYLHLDTGGNSGKIHLLRLSSKEVEHLEKKGVVEIIKEPLTPVPKYFDNLVEEGKAFYLPYPDALEEGFEELNVKAVFPDGTIHSLFVYRDGADGGKVVFYGIGLEKYPESENIVIMEVPVLAGLYRSGKIALRKYPF